MQVGEAEHGRKKRLFGPKIKPWEVFLPDRENWGGVRYGKKSPWRN